MTMTRKSERPPAGEYLGSMTIGVYREADGNINVKYDNDFAERLQTMQEYMSNAEKTVLVSKRRAICSLVANWFLEIYNPDKREVTE